MTHSWHTLSQQASLFAKSLMMLPPSTPNLLYLPPQTLFGSGPSGAPPGPRWMNGLIWCIWVVTPSPDSPLLSFFQLHHLFGICLKNRPCSFPYLCKQNDISFIKIRDERNAIKKIILLSFGDKPKFCINISKQICPGESDKE